MNVFTLLMLLKTFDLGFYFPRQFVQPFAFLNQVFELKEVAMSPEQLLTVLLDLETELGRDRSNEPDRVIDLDLLYYGSVIRREPRLRLPHPRAHRRPFVLQSMVELAPSFLHPVLVRTQTELLVKVRDKTHEDNY